MFALLRLIFNRHTVKVGGTALSIVIPVLTAHEGLRTEPYQDIAGVNTVCYGETLSVKVNQTYTPDECLQMLRERVEHDFQEPLEKCVKDWEILPSETQAAAISLAYNIGVNGFCNSSVNKEFTAGNYLKACDKFLLWNKATVHGRLKQVEGLLIRRADERALCLKGLNGKHQTS